jgi:hypothetical protein
MSLAATLVRVAKNFFLLACVGGIIYVLIYVTTRHVNVVARTLTVTSIAGFPMLLGLPCLCCMPALRKPVATLGVAWALVYVFGMTLGIRTSASYTAWFFNEMWLTFVVKSVGLVIFYGILVLGLFVSNVVQIMLLTLIIWALWNLHQWLRRGHAKMAQE